MSKKLKNAARADHALQRALDQLAASSKPFDPASIVSGRRKQFPPVPKTLSTPRNRPVPMHRAGGWRSV